jgi:hypothetical protein
MPAAEEIQECSRTVQALVDVLLVGIAHILRVDLELVPHLDQLVLDWSHCGPPPCSAFFIASHAARCVACHGVRSHSVPVALVGECFTPAV